MTPKEDIFCYCQWDPWDDQHALLNNGSSVMLEDSIIPPILEDLVA